jgi:hypothetical protein
MRKQERVPGMREAKPNREQRRHPEGRPEDEPMVRDEQAPQPLEPAADPRAKSSGHKKKTADNWNQ